MITLVFALLSKNIIRSRTGRALQAIRDRDIAAEVMGVPEFKYKLIGFAISSFYAGIGGALFASYNGRMSPVNWSLRSLLLGRVHRGVAHRRQPAPLPVPFLGDHIFVVS